MQTTNVITILRRKKNQHCIPTFEYKNFLLYKVSEREIKSECNVETMNTISIIQASVYFEDHILFVVVAFHFMHVTLP